MAKKKNDNNKKSKELEEVKSEKVTEKVKEDKKEKNDKKDKVRKSEKTNKKIEVKDDGFNADVFHVVIVAGIIILVFCIFYWITYFITNKDNPKKNDDKSTEVSISYDRIILGRSFSMNGEYLVLYYDMTNEEISSTYSSLVSTYKNKTEEALSPLYIVNMGDAINKAYSSDTANYEAKSASELKINGPTLIRYKDGSIIEYLEGEETIKNSLN